MGSADLMERNLDRRIEVLVPVLDPELQARLLEVLDLNLADDTNSWVLGPNGTWERVPTVEGISAQRRLQELARDRARRRRDADTLGATRLITPRARCRRGPGRSGRRVRRGVSTPGRGRRWVSPHPAVIE